MLDHHQSAKHIIDGTAAAAALGGLTGYVPSVAAILAIIWYLLQIYDWCARKYKIYKNNKVIGNK